MLTIAERNTYIVAHLPMVRQLAGKVARVTPAADADDLTQAACMRLLMDGQRFDPTRGLQFATFARARATGAMVDALRAEHGRYRDGQPTRTFVSLTADPDGDDDAWSALGVEPEAPARAESNEQAAILADAMLTLSEREREVLILSFWGELSLAEIGNRLGLGASRVCQLRQLALERLRLALAGLEVAA